MKTKLLTICLLLFTIFTSNVLSKNHQEIIGIWHITDNTGGVAVFDRATFKRLIIFKDESLYKAVVMSYKWADANSCKEIEINGDLEIDCRWSDIIGFIPTTYIENKISDFDSAEHFISNTTKEFCTFNDEYDECYQSDNYQFKLTTQNEVIDCIQNNKNEVLSEYQESFSEDNYYVPNVPKIWSCIYSMPSFFKKRY